MGRSHHGFWFVRILFVLTFIGSLLLPLAAPLAPSTIRAAEPSLPPPTNLADPFWPAPLAPITPLIACPNDPNEPNDTLADATPVVLGLYQDHSICAAGDADWVEFEALAGASYTAQAYNTWPDTVLDLTIVDAQGTVLATGTFNNSSVRASFTPTISGSYYVHVAHINPDAGNPTMRYRIIVFATACTDPTEPQGTSATAFTLSLNTAVRAAFCTSGDQDWFQVNVTPGELYEIHYTDPGPNAQMTLRVFSSANLTTPLLPSFSTYPQTPEMQLAFVAPVTGLVYIRLDAAAANTRTRDSLYSLRVTSATCSDAAQEPDNSANPSMTLTSIPQTRSLCIYGDEDWFTFTAQQNTTYRIETALQNGPFTPEVAILPLTSQTPKATGTGGSVQWQADASGVYRVRVRISNQALHTGLVYSIQLVPPKVCPDAFEPGDNTQTGAISLTNTPLAIHSICSIATVDDHDWFVFTPASSGQHAFAFTNTAMIAYVNAGVYAADGTTYLGSFASSPVSSELLLTLTANQIYYIKVSASIPNRNDAAYTYALAVAPRRSYYDPTEPNDTSGTAALLSLDVPIEGQFRTSNDRDYFSLPVVAGFAYRITVQPLSDGVYPSISINSATPVPDTGRPLGESVFIAQTTGNEIIQLVNLGGLGRSYFSYSLLAEEMAPDPDVPAESPEDAAVLLPDTTYTRHLQRPYEAEWLTWDGWAGQMYTITLRKVTPELVWAWSLHDYELERVRIRNRDIAITSTVTLSDTVQVHIQPEHSGPLFLKMANAASNRTAGEYTIQVVDDPHVPDPLIPASQENHIAAGAVEVLDTERESRDRVNVERTQRGMFPLVDAPELRVAARLHSMHMQETGTLGHIWEDGTSWIERANVAGYLGGSIMENAAGPGTPGYDPVVLWMGSMPHRRALLWPDNRDVGLGVSEDGQWNTAVMGYTENVYPILINNDALTTTTALVSVTMAPIPLGETDWQYQLSNTPSFDGAVWTTYPMVPHTYTDISYAAPIEATTPQSVTWELLPGSGNQTVYSRYRQAGGTPLQIMSDRILVQLPPVIDPTQPPLPVAMISPRTTNEYPSATARVQTNLQDGALSPQWLNINLVSLLTDMENGRQSELVGSGASLSIPAIVRIPDHTPANPDDDVYALLWESRLWRLVRDWSRPGKVWQLERSSDTTSDISSWDLRITEGTGSDHSIDGGRFWSMQDQHGMTWVFGATMDSAWRWIDSAGMLRGWRWNLTQQRDLFGNAQTWTYTTETAQTQGHTYDRAGYPISVTWNGNPAAGIAATHRAEFSYEARGASDASIDTVFFTSKRLKSIQFLVQNELINTLDLTYAIETKSGRDQLILTSAARTQAGATSAAITWDFEYLYPGTALNGARLAVTRLNGTPKAAFAYTSVLTSSQTTVYMREYTINQPTEIELSSFLNDAWSQNKIRPLILEDGCDESIFYKDKIMREHIEPRLKYETGSYDNYTYRDEIKVQDCQGNEHFIRARTYDLYVTQTYKEACVLWDGVPYDGKQYSSRLDNLNSSEIKSYCHKNVNNLEAIALSSGEIRIQVPAIFEDIKRSDGTYEHRQTGFTYNAAGHPLYMDTFGDLDVAGDESYVAYTYGVAQFPDLVTDERYYNANGLIQARKTTKYVPGTRQAAEIGRWLLEEQRVLTTTYTYNTRGWLEQEISPLGATTTYEYDSLGNTTAITDALGYATTMTYDEQGRLLSQTAPNQGQTIYSYNVDGSLHAVTDPLQRTTEYMYDAHSRRTGSIDPLNHTSAIEYNDLNRPITITNALGASTIYLYDERGSRVGSIDARNYASTLTIESGRGLPLADTNALSATTTTEYDGNGRIVLQKDPLGAVTINTYDGNGHIATVTDPLSATTFFAYDQFGNRISQTNALSQTSLYAYDSLQRLVVITDTLQQETHYFYDDDGHQIKIVAPNMGETLTSVDALGRPVTVTDALSGTVIYDYDSMGRMISQTDPLNNVSTWKYDLAGQLVIMTNTLGLRTSYGYDAVGNTIAITDIDGLVTHSVYDAANQRVQSIDPLGRITSYGYDAVGNTLVITSPTGAVTSMTPDAIGQIVSTENPLGATATTTYDASGNAVAMTSTLDVTSTIAYDLNHHPLTVTDGLGRETTYVYDLLGRQIRTTDPAGITTAYLYDTAGRVMQVIENVQPSVPASNDVNVTTSYTYDTGGNLHSITDANGHTTVMEYDLLGHQTRYTDPLSRTTVLTYTLRGELAAMQDPLDQITAYTYDTGGRLVEVDYAGINSDVTYVYDNASRLAKMTDGQGTTLYTYDSFGRMISMTDSADHTIIYTYDTVHDEPRTISFDAAPAVAYTYDELNRVATLTAPNGGISTYSYRSDTRLPTLISRPGLRSGYTYTASDQIATITHTRLEGGMRQLWRNRQSYTYTYDVRDTVVAITETLAPLAGLTGTTSTYDSLNRLQTIAYPALPGVSAQTMDYTLDAAGNRLDDSLVQQTYDDADQIDGMTYDANGNLLNDGTTIYTYDGANRLVNSVAPTGTTTYAYNGHNLVVQETLTVASVVTTTEFIWDERSGLPRLLGSVRSDGQREQYVYGPEGVHAQYISEAQSSSTLLYTLMDRQGSVRGLENISAQTSSAVIYDAWGNVRWQTGALSSRLGYTGELTNAVDGTVFLRARHYLPTLGRFLQRDSFQGNLESPQTIHKYTYGNNNPLFYTDPTGHCPESDNFWVCVQTLGFSEEQKAEWMQFVAWRLQVDPYIDTRDMPDFDQVYIEDAYTAAYIWDSYMGADLKDAERDLRQLRYYVDEKNGNGIYSWLKLYQTYLIGPVVRQAQGINDLPGPSSDSEFYSYLDTYHICYNKGDQILDMASEEAIQSAAEFGALTASTMREASRYRSKGSAFKPHAGTNGPDHAPGGESLPKLPGCSFTADTLVSTADGLTPIGDLAVGELVWAYNEATGTTGLYTITAVLAHADPVLVDLTIDGEPLTTTPEHPFFTRERSWVPADDLRLGDHIRAADGSWGTVERWLLRRDTRVMYNLTVATAHTFFVGRGQWLVHNQCIEPHTRPNYSRGKADADAHGIQYHGDYPETGQVPDAILYRADHTGKMLSYAIYDGQGFIVKRVDLDPTISKPHNGVAPPHVHDYKLNVDPEGNSHPGEIKKARPAEPFEQ